MKAITKQLSGTSPSESQLATGIESRTQPSTTTLNGPAEETDVKDHFQNPVMHITKSTINSIIATQQNGHYHIQQQVPLAKANITEQVSTLCTQ